MSELSFVLLRCGLITQKTRLTDTTYIGRGCRADRQGIYQTNEMLLLMKSIKSRFKIVAPSNAGRVFITQTWDFPN